MTGRQFFGKTCEPVWFYVELDWIGLSCYLTSSGIRLLWVLCARRG